VVDGIPSIKQKGKSPLEPKPKVECSPLENIPRIKLDITTQEIVEILNKCRAGI